MKKLKTIARVAKNMAVGSILGLGCMMALLGVIGLVSVILTFISETLELGDYAVPITTFMLTGALFGFLFGAATNE